jgi:hypothetical protein
VQLTDQFIASDRNHGNLDKEIRHQQHGDDHRKSQPDLTKYILFWRNIRLNGHHKYQINQNRLRRYVVEMHL